MTCRLILSEELLRVGGEPGDCRLIADACTDFPECESVLLCGQGHCSAVTVFVCIRVRVERKGPGRAECGRRSQSEPPIPLHSLRCDFL